MIFTCASPTLQYMSKHRFTNALIHESSPYLLQHAHNPVQWYPWSEEALKKAKAEDKPILLSIGYSACHWCHVMERESFENERIAELMNGLFVNIKVDREERPDLDAVYMQAVQMITGRGGWPMTVFLTPDQVPFYGGTYFPPEDRHGIPGFPSVLSGVADAYRTRRQEIDRNAASIARELQKSSRFAPGPGELTQETLEAAAAALLASFDEQNGGFGTAPKFPPSMSLDFLMRVFARSGKRRLLDVVELTLQKMLSGGIYDQLGGGFHRYSVDAHWLVPHFEKMLYDNALLSRVYLDAFLLTGNPQYRRAVEETLDYVLREMSAHEGGFFSTQDADSEGVEGKYYTWERQEVEGLLAGDEAELFCRYYGISDEGSLEGRNILWIPRHAALVARLNKVPEQELLKVLDHGRRQLFAARECRVRPERDEKILTSWNGLMLRSFAESARSLGRADYGEAARRCAGFLLARLRPEGRLLHSYRDGMAKIDAFLEDYAFLMDGLLALYEADFDTRWLNEATGLACVMVEKFRDPVGTGFFLTSSEQEPLISRPKDLYDNATPSGNSVAVYALLRLARFTGEDRWLEPALTVVKAMAQTAGQHPSAFGNLLCAFDFALPDIAEIAVVGNPREEATISMLREVFSRYIPNKVVVCGETADVSLLKGRIMISGRPTAYVCRDRVCLEPATEAAQLAARLEELQPGLPARFQPDHSG